MAAVQLFWVPIDPNDGPPGTQQTTNDDDDDSSRPPAPQHADANTNSNSSTGGGGVRLELQDREAVSPSPPVGGSSSSRRVVMEVAVDGAPGASTPMGVGGRTNSDSPRGRPTENDSADGGSITTTNNSNNANSSSTGDGGAKSSQGSSSAETTPRRATPRAKSANPPATHGRDKMGPGGGGGGDLSLVGMKTSWDGSGSATSGGGATKGEAAGETSARGGAGGGEDGCGGGDGEGEAADSGVGGADGGSGGPIFAYTSLRYRAGMLADPAKIAKEREKEERVKQAREKLEEERRKKLEELKEQQRLAQENRDKQLEMRRRKIEDLRRRDFERRAAVEERRKMKEEVERIRRESILQKAEERVARYEAWKAGGRKVDHAHTEAGDIISTCMFGMEGSTPKHLSMSTSVLYHKRNSDVALSAAVHRPDSSLGLNTIREGRRSFVGRTSGGVPSSSSPGSVGGSTWSPVRLREKSSPRKQRPSSVATSMPSFVGGEPAKTPRSKSHDRTSRDRSKHRVAGGHKDDKARVKIRDKEENKDENKDDNDGTTKKGRVSLSFFDRLATPKFSKGQQEASKEPTPRKDAPIIRIISPDESSDNDWEEAADNGSEASAGVELSPRKAYSTTNLAAIKKKSSFKEKTPRDNTPRKPSPAVTVKVSTPRASTVGSSGAPSSTSSTHAPAPSSSSSSTHAVKSVSSPRRTPPPSATSVSSPQHTAHAPSSGGPSAASGGGGSSEDGTTGPRGVNVDITEEAYKAKLAEKRRQAREKAEREAEEEKRRQEEARIAEEERLRQEEEEQKRMEEESNRLAQEARKAEEERLQRAIEAEEKRKKEEAERLEQERKAKEEAERKAKEEAERLEKEKQERLRKEEEERQQRKKKLEMIMKRVKTDPAQQDTLSQKSESPTKSVGNSPNRSTVSSPDIQEKPAPFQQTSEEEGEEPKEQSEASTGVAVTEERNATGDIPTTTSNMVTRSASSGDILDGATAREEAKEQEKEALSQMTTSTSDITPSMTKSDDEGNGNGHGTLGAAPAESSSSVEAKSRFKSPLLQQLVENKGGDTPPGTPKFKSPLLQNLLGKTKVGARMGMSSSLNDLTSNKDNNSSSSPSKPDSGSTSPYGSTKEISKQGVDEDKDEDESVSSGGRSGGHLTNGVERHEEPSPTETKLSPSGMNDSALGASIEPGMTSSQSLHLANGHGKDTLQDSSISLHSLDGGVPASSTSQAFDQPAVAQEVEEGQQQVPDSTESGGQPGGEGSGGGGQFEELIELLEPSGGKASAVLGPGSTPIIAFEENNRMTDLSESLS